MSGKDYRKFYRIQNKIFQVLKPVLADFYLTGGTALGRFFLNHRYSEDLDFFVNSDPGFQKKLLLIEKTLNNEVTLLREQTVVYEDFARYYIETENSFLKIEFVNDVQYRSSKPLKSEFCLIDTPLNILANKLTAVIGRDEPKDIFDIYALAQSYSFNWMEVFYEAKKKNIINEIDIEQRIRSFPVDLINDVDWLLKPFDREHFRKVILTIANDFILGRDNSAGKDQIHIKQAILLPIYK